MSINTVQLQQAYRFLETEFSKEITILCAEIESIAILKLSHRSSDTFYSLLAIVRYNWGQRYTSVIQLLYLNEVHLSK